MADPATTLTFTTASLPVEVPDLVIETRGAAAPTGGPHTVLNAAQCDFSGAEYGVLYDLDGIARWYYELPSSLWGDVVVEYLGGGRLSWGGGFTTSATTHVIAMDGTSLDFATWPGIGGDSFTHDGTVLDDGRYLSFAWVDNRSGARRFDGFEVYVTTPGVAGLDWSWNSQVGIDAGLLPTSDAHGNWADIVTYLDGTERLYASLCYTDLIVAVDVASGSVLWRLGRDGDFTVVDAAGAALGDAGFTDCQHGVDVDGDRLIAYDNGVTAPNSRVVEYTLDEATMTATLDWTWTEPGWNHDWLGDVDWLPGDHVLITRGNQDCSWGGGDSVKTRFVEVDKATDAIVWKAAFGDDDHLSYRAQRTDACDVMPDVRWCPDADLAYAEAAKAFGG
jgi:hypothetical protein